MFNLTIGLLPYLTVKAIHANQIYLSKSMNL